jgi:hypothetical protein
MAKPKANRPMVSKGRLAAVRVVPTRLAARRVLRMVFMAEFW